MKMFNYKKPVLSLDESYIPKGRPKGGWSFHMPLWANIVHIGVTLGFMGAYGYILARMAMSLGDHDHGAIIVAAVAFILTSSLCQIESWVRHALQAKCSSSILKLNMDSETFSRLKGISTMSETVIVPDDIPYDFQNDMTDAKLDFEHKMDQLVSIFIEASGGVYMSTSTREVLSKEINTMYIEATATRDSLNAWAYELQQEYSPRNDWYV